jgi:hypothetical protein
MWVSNSFMRRFKSIQQAKCLLCAHAAEYNFFNPGRHLVTAQNTRNFRLRAFVSWE